MKDRNWWQRYWAAAIKGRVIASSIAVPPQAERHWPSLIETLGVSSLQSRCIHIARA
jgi:hypothetical protein